MSECKLWTRARTSQGYGMCGFNKKTVYVHRLAYCQANDVSLDSIKGLCVLHRCDTPSCYNPDHLFLGTRKDNHDDMWAKGRQAKGRVRLTEAQLEDICMRYVPGVVTHKMLASEYGVSTSQLAKHLLKSRGHRLEGEKCVHAKLTRQDVEEIRALYASTNLKQRHLAKMYGVAISQISRVVNKKTWKG